MARLELGQFPNRFTDEVEVIRPTIGERGSEALERLNKKDFRVVTGLTPYFSGAISVMARQRHIQEYCPRDATTDRFASMRSTEDWLKKMAEGLCLC